MRLIFDDLHSTGIFTWDYLHELGSRHDEKWAVYEAELKTKGLSRDPDRTGMTENPVLPEAARQKRGHDLYRDT